MNVVKLQGYQRIFHAESFPADFAEMFGKNKGEMPRYQRWLSTWLLRLDDNGMKALTLKQFEHLKNTENPVLYAIRHLGDSLNDRYIYCYANGESAILLTAFSEGETSDYQAAIARAHSICEQIDWRKYL